MRFFRSVGFVLCLALALPARADVATTGGGMIATAHPLASDSGAAVFKQGGNAVDAAVAAAMMLGVVDPSNSGIGGGCFILVRKADGEFIALDGRETAPAKASRDMYLRDGKPTTQLSQTGALASGVPGALMAYERIIQLAGKKNLPELVAPAADVAENGFAIDDRFVKRIDESLSLIREFSEAARIFLKPDGKPRAAGELLKQTDLAASYRKIAAEGSNWFYRGPFAAATAKWMSENGGLMTESDFAAYEVKLRQPLRTQYRGCEIVGFPPPSSGGVHVAQILNILARFNLAGASEADRIHITAEAMKLAFADRAHWLGDPDFVKVPTGLINPDYGAQLAKQINPAKAGQFDHGQPPQAQTNHFEDQKHTTHIAAADKDGNFVAITTTLNTAFGSKVIVPGTGVLLNNQMDDFSIAPGQANYYKLFGSEANAVAAGKRPLSSMSPTIVLKDGQPFMTIGAAGGPTIITQVTLVLSNVLDLSDDLPAAMKRPRFHHQWTPDKLSIENTLPEAVRKELENRGHILDVKKPAGATNAVLRLPDGTFVGVSEPRTRGKAAGFE